MLGDLPEDQFQGQNGAQDDNVRIDLNAGALEQELLGDPVEEALRAVRVDDPVEEALRAVRVDDGNVHINAGGVNIAIELPYRGERADPPNVAGVNNPRDRVRARGRLSHRNENSPFYQLDPRNIQIMRARIAIISSEFVKRIKCNLSGEFPPNNNFLTPNLIHISNLITQLIRSP